MFTSYPVIKRNAVLMSCFTYIYPTGCANWVKQKLQLNCWSLWHRWTTWVVLGVFWPWPYFCFCDPVLLGSGHLCVLSRDHPTSCPSIKICGSAGTLHKLLWWRPISRYNRWSCNLDWRYCFGGKVGTRWIFTSTLLKTENSLNGSVTSLK